MIEAVVQAGAWETSYRRAGAGSPVLLLVGDGAEPRDWLFRTLAARFRVVAATRPVGADTFEAWLRGLIDGLGLEQPAVVAWTAEGGALLGFAAIDPHRLRRLALVHDAATPRPPAGPLDDAIAAALHPILVLPIPEPADVAGRLAAEEALARFLAAP